MGGGPLARGEGVIAHEYGHGISNRLTGGRTNVSCLNNAEQMGEGWSDWFGIVLTATPGDTRDTVRGVGTYVTFQPADGRGIRPTPYSTDMSVNPSTYASLLDAAITQPHGIGYVWNTMLWEMYWNLVDKHGFNPDIYGDWDSGGNNLAMQLVMDGMKFQTCNPGFVDGRDAILAADVALGGNNQCEIWGAFAKRGLGVSASQGSSNNRSDGVEAFVVDMKAVRVEYAFRYMCAHDAAEDDVAGFADIDGNQPLAFEGSRGFDDVGRNDRPPAGGGQPGKSEFVDLVFERRRAQVHALGHVERNHIDGEMTGVENVARGVVRRAVGLRLHADGHDAGVGRKYVEEAVGRRVHDAAGRNRRDERNGARHDRA